MTKRNYLVRIRSGKKSTDVGFSSLIRERNHGISNLDKNQSPSSASVWYRNRYKRTSTKNLFSQLCTNYHYWLLNYDRIVSFHYQKFWKCNFHWAILCCDDYVQRMYQQGHPRANQSWRAPFSRSYREQETICLFLYFKNIF